MFRKKDVPMKRLNNPTNQGQPVHGAFVEAKRYRERSLDLRRRDDRAIQAWQQAVIADLGGADQLDMLQNSLLDRATEVMIVLRCMADHVEKTGIIAGNGELVPCLRTSYLSYCGTFARLMNSIYGRVGQKPNRLPTIQDLIDGHHNRDPRP